ncbi:MAG: indole-3-glycerol-phosphate synthase, partial [Bacteroidota bacterium]
FFGGSSDDLKLSRQNLDIPILRKEFIVDEYQIIEAKALGADVILLIAECLNKKEIKHFTKLANSLDMEVLLELHSEDQLNKISEWPDFIGVNNRNLSTFQVSIQTSLDLADKLPENILKVSESGLSLPNSIHELKNAGYKGFLIGENFMSQTDPGLACADFIQKLKNN